MTRENYYRCLCKTPHNHKPTNLLHHGLNPDVGSSTHSVRTWTAVQKSQEKERTKGQSMDSQFSLEVSTPEIAFPDVSVTQGRSIPVSEKNRVITLTWHSLPC